MRYHEITEAPIGDLETHHMERPGTFPDADRKLLSQPQHLEKIRKRFAKTPFIFNLYFFNQHPKNYVEDGQFSPEWTKDILVHGGATTPSAIYNLTGLTIKPDPSAISVLFLSNANAQLSISMTPWIVAHRIGHGLMDNNSAKPAGLTIQSGEVPGTQIDTAEIMTTRSGRTNQVLEGEETAELIAQYILQGQATFKYPDDASQEDQQAIDNFQQAVNDYISHLLQNCVGKIFISL